MKGRIEALRFIVIICGIIGSIFLAYNFGNDVEIGYYGRVYEERNTIRTIIIFVVGLFNIFAIDTILGALEAILNNQETITKLLSIDTSECVNTEIENKDTNQDIDLSVTEELSSFLNEIDNKNNSNEILKLVKRYFPQEEQLILEIEELISMEQKYGNQMGLFLQQIKSKVHGYIIATNTKSELEK